MQLKRTWPMPNAIAALVLFAVLVPLACTFLGFWLSFSLPGGTPPSDDNRDVTRGLFIAGGVSALVAIGMALASAVAGRGVAVRVVAVVAILVALATGGFLGVMLLSEARSQVDSSQGPAEPAAPSCGPESHPTVFGGDSRYEACADDIATADEFLQSAVTQLPTEDVTVASVDAIASGIEPESYDTTYEFGNGDITVAWLPAPVTCAVATWRDGVWMSEVVGLLADGGCIYMGG